MRGHHSACVRVTRLHAVRDNFGAQPAQHETRDTVGRDNVGGGAHVAEVDVRGLFGRLDHAHL